MLEAQELQSRFLLLNPAASLVKIRRAQKKRNTNPRYLSRLLISIRSRCNNNPHYSGRGIKCFLTVPQLRYLWNRDCAASLDRATIDRINPHGHYEVDNCRFVEQSLNTSRAAIDSWLRKPEGTIVVPVCGSCGAQFPPALASC